MNLNDFRCLRRGVNIDTLDPEESSWLKEYKHQGKKHERALLMIHGFSSSPAVFRYFFEALPHYDCIHAPVLPGHGDSLEAFAAASGHDWTKHVNDCFESLAKQYKKVDVMGISLGGLLAYNLAQHRTINHLYLLAPAMHLQLSPLNHKSALMLAQSLSWLKFSRIRNNAGTILNDHFYEITYRQLAIPAIIALLTLIDEFHFTPPTCPTDVFLGRYDNVVDSNKVAEHFNGCDKAQIHWLEQSAHVISIDNDFANIIEWVNQLFEQETDHPLHSSQKVEV